MTKSNRGFFNNQGDVTQINDSILPVFKLVQDFIHVHIITKLHEHLIKTERVIVMTKSNRGFFSNQGDLNLRLTIGSGQYTNLTEILSMSTLCLFQESPIKSEGVI